VFLPWRADRQGRTAWLATATLLAANAVAFVFTASAAHREPLFAEWGFVPARVLAGEAVPSLITSMFLHAGVLHLAANLLYLGIFGARIEGVLGSGKYIAFYVVCGLGGHLAQTLADPTSPVPVLGASGAIAGILGAYLVGFPDAKVTTFLYLVFVAGNFRMPAAVVIGVWFLVQLLGSLGGAGGTVAWFEHLGGFALGLLLFPLIARRSALRSTHW
jgi:membrane associated rhomboid family serine protease